jgi:hypothetical protein
MRVRFQSDVVYVFKCYNYMIVYQNKHYYMSMKHEEVWSLARILATTRIFSEEY